MVLPSTFMGGARYMKQCYHDAMAIVRKYGKPDLFITFTCNPRWPEITDNLGRWSVSNDRPELVARVFHAKLKQLMLDITVNNVFGIVEAYVYTVEFQKRGLPHAHILIILREESKLLTADDVDNLVCAYLPDPATNRRLFDSVTSHMIHGPCGNLNRSSPCMVDNSCSKNYPKEYSDETVYVSDGGYPKYRRPNGPVVRVRDNEISNEFVVPHSPYLLAKYDAHINIEVCSTVKSVMYLYKYVYKGHDAATMELWNGDEIESFINARYVSAPEAVWRLYSYELHKISHTVVRLPVHLENYHNVYFAPGQVQERVQNAALGRTKLTAFFALNAADEEARQYLYHDIPVHYTWNAQRRRWDRRQRRMAHETLARMYVVNPLDRDRFHLRLLLLHLRGPQSFRDMRTVGGVVHPTYAAAGDLLRARGKTLADFGLPNPDVALLGPEEDDPMSGAIDAAVGWALQVDNMIDEQVSVYQRVMAAVDDNRNVQKMFYVDGPGGTGKITLYGCLISSIRNTGRSVLCVAFTGIAASLMDGGMTVHSTFGLPMGTLTDQSTSSITMQSSRARRIRDAALIVWDEAPMSSGLQLTVVDCLLRDVMGSELPFGGKPVLFAGDFRQILSVVRRGNRGAVVMSSIKHNPLWRHFEQLRLTRNMRAGNGQLPTVDGVPDTVEIPPELVCDVVDLIDFVYPQLMSMANVDDYARKIVLCPRNEQCQQVNRSVLQRVEGAERTYYAIDTVVVDDPDEVANYPTEFLNSLQPNGLPPYALTLKVGSIVMLLRNIDSRRRLCNGTRLVVTELRRHNFKARMLSGEGDDDIVLPATPLTSGEEDDLPFQLRRVQYPVRLSFAMTINKSQGQTFDRVGLLLPSPVLTHGQLYVAFSRVRNSQSVRVGMYGDDSGRFVTKNIVYREVL